MTLTAEQIANELERKLDAPVRGERGWEACDIAEDYQNDIRKAIAALRSLSAGEAVATLHDDGYFTWRGTKPPEMNYAGWRMDVYAHPAPASWTEVGERLPVENDGEPDLELCVDYDIGGVPGYFGRKLELGYFLDGRFCTNTDMDITKHVTHWREATKLPAPPTNQAKGEGA